MGEDLPDDPGRALEPLTDPFEALLGGGGISARDRLAREAEVVRHPLEGVVDLVGDAGGEPADGAQPLRVKEPALELAHAHFLLRPRLQALAPPRLLDRER